MIDLLFLQIVNMSFTASFVILLVLLARLFLKKVPKVFSYSLWSVVLLRLAIPFSFESVISLLPIHTAPIPKNIMYERIPKIDTGISFINDSVNSILPPAQLAVSINPMQVLIFFGRVIWIMGIAVLFIYSIQSFVKLKRKLRTAVHQGGNIYHIEGLVSPFVIGALRPKIYLPANLSESERRYILLHEQTHIKYLDHVVKIISFALLCVHWFNPLVWAAFFLSGRDMEMTCDERVIMQLGSNVKKEYSSSLLSLASGRKIVGGTPLAFGEGDTKSRIKNVLNYRKPAFIITGICAAGVISVCIGLMANPKGELNVKEVPVINQDITELIDWGIEDESVGTLNFDCGNSWEKISVEVDYFPVADGITISDIRVEPKAVQFQQKDTEISVRNEETAQTDIGSLFHGEISIQMQGKRLFLPTALKYRIALNVDNSTIYYRTDKLEPLGIKTTTIFLEP